MSLVRGLHHITVCAGGAQEDIDFMTQVCGQRLIKQTVLFDGRFAHYHLYYANADCEPGSQEAAVFDGLEEVLDNEVGGERAFAQDFFGKPSMLDAVKMLEHPILMGFVELPPTKVSFDGSLRRRSRALYVVHL